MTASDASFRMRDGFPQFGTAAVVRSTFIWWEQTISVWASRRWDAVGKCWQVANMSFASNLASYQRGGGGKIAYCEQPKAMFAYLGFYLRRPLRAEVLCNPTTYMLLAHGRRWTLIGNGTEAFVLGEINQALGAILRPGPDQMVRDRKRSRYPQIGILARQRAPNRLARSNHCTDSISTSSGRRSVVSASA